MAKRKRTEAPIYEGEITVEMLDVVGAAIGDTQEALETKRRITTRMFYYGAKAGDGLQVPDTALIVTPQIAEEVWGMTKWEH